MPLGQSKCIPQADPRGVATPRFWHRLIRFRHVISGSLALASLNHTCRNLVPTFPQRSPPLLLTTAACGGLRSTPDCRPRRAFLHLSYSYAAPCGPALLVTQCQFRTNAQQQATSSFYDFVGAGRQTVRHLYSERLCSLQINHEFEPGRLYNRQLRWFCTLEYPTSVVTDLLISISETGPIAHQPSCRCKFAKFVNGGKLMR